MTRRMAQTVRSPVARRAPTARVWALIQVRSENCGAKAARMATISGGRSTGGGLRERWLVSHHRSWLMTPGICQPTWPKSSDQLADMLHLPARAGLRTPQPPLVLRPDPLGLGQQLTHIVPDGGVQYVRAGLLFPAQ